MRDSVDRHFKAIAIPKPEYVPAASVTAGTRDSNPDRSSALTTPRQAISVVWAIQVTRIAGGAGTIDTQGYIEAGFDDRRRGYFRRTTTKPISSTRLKPRS